MGYYEYNDASGIGYGVVATVLAILGVWIVVVLAVAVFMVICNWKIYKKAGKEGWESIIPIYNLIVKFQFLDIPVWMIILLFIPGANIAIPIITAINMAKKFGKDGGYAVGLIFLPIIFYPMLAFGSSEFIATEKGIFEGTSNSSSAKYCGECGTEVTGKYCSKCGKEI